MLLMPYANSNIPIFDPRVKGKTRSIVTSPIPLKFKLIKKTIMLIIKIEEEIIPTSGVRVEVNTELL